MIMKRKEISKHLKEVVNRNAIGFLKINEKLRFDPVP